jgi:predicted MFS family arabinose efflux permease
LIVGAVLFFRQNNYRQSYLILLIPALCALSILLAAKKLYPHPRDLEIKTVIGKESGSIITPAFVLFTISAMCLATGYVDYPLIAYHFKQKGLVMDAWIPVLYALAMLSEAFTALISGRLYDQTGPWILAGCMGLSLFFAPFVFLMNQQWAIAGMILWGIGMGVQGSVMRAIIADMIPAEKRATVFGMFDTFFGIAWFAGSAYMGYLYDRSVTSLVVFSMNMQTVSIVILILFIVKFKRDRIRNT